MSAEQSPENHPRRVRAGEVIDHVHQTGALGAIRPAPRELQPRPHRHDDGEGQAEAPLPVAALIAGLADELTDEDSLLS